MIVTAEIIKRFLSDVYNILSDSLPSNPSVCGFRLYDGSPLDPDHLYIMEPEDLAFLNPEERHGIILCNGAEDAGERPLQAAVGNYPLQTPDGDEHSMRTADAVILWLQEKTERDRLLNALSSVFERMEQWEALISRVRPDTASINKVLNESRKFLRGSIILANNRFRYIAYTNDFRGNAALLQSGDTVPRYVMEDILTDPAYQNVQSSREVTLYQIHTAKRIVPALCYNLFKKDSGIYNARIMLASAEPFTPDQYDLLKILGDSIAGALWQIAPFSYPVPAFSSLHNAVESSLRKEPSSRPLVSSILRMVHWDVNDRYVLALFSPYFIKEKEEINAVSVNQLELLFPNSCGVIIDQNIALLINLGSSEKKEHFRFQENIAIFLRDSLYKAGISEEFNDFFRIRYALYEAQTALEIGNIKNSMYWYYRFSDYVLDYMIEHASHDVYYRDLLEPSYLELLEYDQEHTTALAATLEQYVKNKFNVTHTAAALYLNRSTVLARLKKIEEITVLNLDDWHTHLHLLLSFAVLENR